MTAAEPPLDEFSVSVAVPDFLTEEQQDLYRNLFGVTSANVDYMGGPFGFSNDTVVIDEMTYTISRGRYRKWADFDTLVHAAFTERFWDEHNNGVSAVGKPWVLFREYNGALCIKMVLTENGWRFDEFHSALVDERGQEIAWCDH